MPGNSRWAIVSELLKKIISVLLIIVPACYFGDLGDHIAMGLAIVAGGVAAAFIFLDKFREFRGAGFEAKLKDTIQEAQVTINQMRDLMTPLVTFALHQITHSNRMGSGIIGRDHIYDLIVSVASKLDIDQDKEVSERIDEFLRYRAFDLYREIYAPRSRIRENGLSFHQEFNDLYDPSSDQSCPNPEEIEAIYEKHETELTPDQRVALADYIAYLEKNPKLRKKQ